MTRRSVALPAAVTAALVLASPAQAHVTVAPERVQPGEETLSFKVPNEFYAAGGRSSIDAVVVKAPTGVRVGNAETKAGWRSAVAGRSVTWSGGSIPYGRYATFGLEVEVPGGSSQLRFEAAERYAAPRPHVERYPVLVSVGDTARSDDSHGLALGGLLVAIAAAVLAAASFFLALAFWLRRP